MNVPRFSIFLLSLLFLPPVGVRGDDVAVAREVDTPAGRSPLNADDEEYWIKNAVFFHRFTLEEAGLALDMTETDIRGEVLSFFFTVNRPNTVAELNDFPSQFEQALETIQSEIPDDQILILPYPGGRHPRIGFLDGAIDPQRETKVSVFTPWQPESERRADYVVVDVPEAIWSNLGLTYLAHTHVPTIWTMQNIELEPLEWDRLSDGVLHLERELPNDITFTSTVVPRADHVDFGMTLTNGTDETLTDLRVQNCVMLKNAEGFNQQTNDNKVFRDHYVAVHDESGERWIITAWLPLHRGWANAPCPCLHSDPKFPDCAPGETQTVRGWLSFYEGEDIQAEFDRIEATQWWEAE